MWLDLKLALRTMANDRFYTLINILGLALGLSASIFIFLWLRHELTFDQFHDNKDRLFRVWGRVITDAETFDQAITPPVMGPALERDFPQVEKAVRVFTNYQTGGVKYADQLGYETDIMMADASFFEVFSFPLLRGDRATVLAEPFSVVLTPQIAQKYFGDEDPIGKVLTVWSDWPLRVTGICEPPPANSHLQWTMLLSFSSFEARNPTAKTSWLWNNFHTYLLLTEGADVGDFAGQLTSWARGYFGDQQENLNMFYEFDLTPLPRLHLHSAKRYEVQTPGSASQVALFGAVGLAILLLACINFINLATARSLKRAKEVGVRKVLGSSRGQFIRQHLMEASLHTFLGLLLALAIFEIGLPHFRNLVGSQLSIGNPWAFAAGCVALTFFVSILSGLYPAFFISAYDPTIVLKGAFRHGARGLWMRKSLVVFQFGVTVFLMVGIGVVHKQFRFLQSRDLGYDPRQVIAVPTRYHYDVCKGFETFRQRLLSESDIVSVTGTSSLIVQGLGNGLYTTENNEGEPVASSIYNLRVDSETLATYGMQMVGGRDFSENHPTDLSEAAIVNEQAVRKFGWNTAQAALGKPFTDGRHHYRVIGVVKDFHYDSLRANVEPVLLIHRAQFFGWIGIRAKAEHPGELVTRIEEIWREMFPDTPFVFREMEDQVAGQYLSERRFQKVFGLFGGLSILIACLGLIGLAAFEADQRAKEISIRKVLGSSIPGIFLLLSREFLLLVLIANLLAWPLAYYGMRQWLEGFTYGIDISLLPFLLAAAASLLIALLTLSYHAIRAAFTNPVEALRYE